MSTGNVNRPTKTERRQQAREQAKAAREAHQKKEKRNRLALQGGIVAGIIAIAVIVTLVIVQNTKPEGPGPKNMASGGAVFEQGFKVATTPALKANEDPVATKVDFEKLPLDIVIYADYMCPICGMFEQANQKLLDGLVEKGDANVELHIITALNEQSLGTKYSSRAANAFGCLVNYSPEHAWKFHSALLSKDVQPKEGTEGLSNNQLIEQAKKAGADTNADIADCIETEEFVSFMDASSDRALAGPIPNLADGTDLPNVQGTPTILVNGVQYLPPTTVPAGATWDNPWSDPTAFSDYVYKVLAEFSSTTPAQ
jgi:protein-disulfide isomerase